MEHETTGTAGPKNKLSQHLAHKTTPTIDSADFSFLARNKYGRYPHPNARTVGHALISHEGGGMTARQFALPRKQEGDLEAPETTVLHDFTRIYFNGGYHLTALGLNGTTYLSKRSIILKEDDTDLELAYFSEEEYFDPDSLPVNERPIVRKKTASTNTNIRGGYDVKVDPISVKAREAAPERGISQNKLMGGSKDLSACQAYKDYSVKRQQSLTHEMIAMLQRSYLANINRYPENLYRPEWLHAVAHSLTHLNKNPQFRENLGAAPKWANTEMMIPEDFAKWFGLVDPSRFSAWVTPTFFMLDQSNLINYIDTRARVTMGSKTIYVQQEIDPFQKKPNFSKPSDLAQLVTVTHALLEAKAAVHTEVISKQVQHVVSRTYQRVPEHLPEINPAITTGIRMTILDLETTGLDPKNGEIIQIGILSVLVNQEAGGIIRVLDSYEGLAEPKEQLQPKVVEVTGLTNDMLRGQRIDWPKVLHLLNRTDIAICHNSTFDRQYLECAAPAEIQERVKQLAFGCTLNGINWTARGFQSRKLVDLNRRIGYIYNANNALNDCKATLNLLVAVPGALEELMNDVHEPKALLCALGTDYNQSDLLRKQNFNWSPEAHGWCKYLSSAQVPVYQQWLTTRLERCYIGIVPGVTAEDRYSPRVQVKLAEQLKTLGLFTEKQDSRTKRKVDQDVVLDAECSL